MATTIRRTNDDDAITEYVRKESWKKIESAANAEDYKKRLDTLQQNIELTKRNLSSLDLYKIEVSITDSKDIGYKISELLPNTAATIATDNSFSWNGEVWYRGDLAFKDENGNLIHIHSDTNGLYFPSKLVKNGNSYIITYGYSNAQPVEGTQSLNDGDDALNHPSKNISLNIDYDASSTVYGIKAQPENGVVVFDVSKNGNNDIFPIIKCFTSYNEEVATSFVLEQINSRTQWQISNIPSIVDYVLIK